MGRPHPDINGHVQNLALHDPAKLRLGVLQLIMQAAQRVLAGTGVVILNKDFANARLRHLALVVAFKEKTAGILMHGRANKIDARDFGLDYLQAAPMAALRP